jgi:hypothetical protein
MFASKSSSCSFFVSSIHCPASDFEKDIDILAQALPFPASGACPRCDRYLVAGPSMKDRIAQELTWARTCPDEFVAALR